jgi:acetyl esterase/lipase
MCPSDPRSRIILHMNWRGQTLPVLCNGLPSKGVGKSKDQENVENRPQPSREQIVRFSPYANIVNGACRSPTYLVHGTKDDLIPWQQSQRTYEAMQEAGIASGITILQDQPHLFDLFSDATRENWQAVIRAYQFVFEQLHI